jgi:RNA polymerase sigma factor (sigma-70 family)
VRDDPSVVDLVTRAVGSDESAWQEIVERYLPLVWSICLRYQLTGADIEDVGQTVWLGLVGQLGRLREPAALPGWLATTTARECIRVLKDRRRYEAFGTDLDDGSLPLEADPAMIEEEILRAERNALLRAALAELSADDRRLIGLLLRDPPLSYAQIGAILGRSPGSIGPTRARCLQRLRGSVLLVGLSDTDISGLGAVRARGAGGGPPAPGESSGGLAGQGAHRARVTFSGGEPR